LLACGNEQRSGNIGADSAKCDQVGRSRLRERLELRVEVIHLAIEVLPARGEAAKHPPSVRDDVGRQDVTKLPRILEEGGK